MQLFLERALQQTGARLLCQLLRAHNPCQCQLDAALVHRASVHLQLTLTSFQVHLTKLLRAVATATGDQLLHTAVPPSPGILSYYSTIFVPCFIFYSSQFLISFLFPRFPTLFLTSQVPTSVQVQEGSTPCTRSSGIGDPINLSTSHPLPSMAF